MRNTAKAIIATQPRYNVQMLPCTIVTVTPLVVNLMGSNVPAMRIPGATYVVAAPAVALFTSPNVPIIIPTGV